MVIDFLESNFDEATKLASADSWKEFDHVTRNYMQFSRFANWKEAVQYLKAGGAFDEPLLIAALAVTMLMHISMVWQDQVWAMREGRQGVGCGIHVGKAIDGSFFPLKKDYGSKVSLVQELVEKVIGNVAQEGTTAAVGEEMVVGGVPVDVVAVPYKVAFGVKHRKRVSPCKALSVMSTECAGVDEAGGGLSSEGVVASPVHASCSAPTVLPDVTKCVLRTRCATSVKTESVLASALASPEHGNRKCCAASSVASVLKLSETPEPVSQKRCAAPTVVSVEKQVVSPERTKRMCCAASSVLIVPKPVERVRRKHHAASTFASDVSTERMSRQCSDCSEAGGVC